MDLLLLVVAFILAWIGYFIGKMVAEHEWTAKLPKLREESIKKSRAVLTGNITEQLAPYLPDFPYNPNECKFIGKPIDFIVFKGLDNGEPEEVVFVEVKTGEATLSQNEKKLKEIIQAKKVAWKEYRKNL